MERARYSLVYCTRQHFIQDVGEPLMTTTCDIPEDDFNRLKALPLFGAGTETVQFTRLPGRQRCSLDLSSVAMMYLQDEEQHRYVIVGRH